MMIDMVSKFHEHCSGFTKLAGSDSDWLVWEDHVFVLKMLWNQIFVW